MYIVPSFNNLTSLAEIDKLKTKTNDEDVNVND